MKGGLKIDHEESYNDKSIDGLDSIWCMSLLSE